MFELLVIFSAIFGVLIIAVKVKHNCEKVGPTVWISSHREMARKIDLEWKLFGACVHLEEFTTDRRFS